LVPLMYMLPATPDAAAVGHAPELALPVRGALDRVQALREAVRGDAHLVHGARVLAQQVPAPHLDRVHADRLGQLVDLALERRSAAAPIRARAWARSTACW
jgi:hypothetical protein